MLQIQKYSNLEVHCDEVKQTKHIYSYQKLIIHSEINFNGDLEVCINLTLINDNKHKANFKKALSMVYDINSKEYIALSNIYLPDAINGNYTNKITDDKGTWHIATI